MFRKRPNLEICSQPADLKKNKNCCLRAHCYKPQIYCVELGDIFFFFSFRDNLNQKTKKKTSLKSNIIIISQVLSLHITLLLFINYPSYLSQNIIRMTVPPFRPYGGEDIRVVSDLSRFDFGGTDQKIRSRNTTPTNTNMLVEDNDDNASSSKLTLDTIIPLYSSKIHEGSKYNQLRQNENQRNPSTQSNPLREEQINIPKRDQKKSKKVTYSYAVQVPQDHLGYVKESQPPIPPPKDATIRNSTGTPYPDNALPPMPQPSDLNQPRFASSGQQQQRIPSGRDGDDSTLTAQQKLERDLIQQVMNHPVIGIRGERFGEQYQDKHFTIGANFVLHVFEVCCSVVQIVLSSILLQKDHDISGGYYRYILADGIISLVISLLFALHIINYEIRNGSFYCLTATICKFASFIVIITTIFPEQNYRTYDIWSMRRGIGAIIIVSTFLWVINLVMFITTLYISRLNLLEEINFDYSYKGIMEESSQRAPIHKSRYDYYENNDDGSSLRRSNSNQRKRHSREEQQEEPLKEFYLNQNGEMYELHEEWEKEQYRGRNKILVYTF